MKIALIRKEYTCSLGGAEHYVVNLSRQLLKMGHEVHVFANTFDRPSDAGITFHKVPVLAFFSPLKNLTFALNTKRLLKKETFDIINGFSQVYAQDIYRMGDGLHLHFLNTQHTNPLIRFLTYLNPRHLVILLIEKQIFKPQHVRHIVANSKMCKSQAIHYYRVPHERIDVIYNGVDLKRFTPGVRETYRLRVRERLHISDQEIVILFVSRNYKRKGLDCLIKSLSHLGEKADTIKVIVVGRGHPRPFKRLAKSIGLSDKIIFVGEETIIETYYGASDLLVLPTRYDPFSNVCLEALACGLPVITTKSNGAAEIIEDGKNGIIVDDAENTEALANAISLLLSKNRREEMGKHAALRAKPYTIEANAQKTLALYQKVLAKKHVLSFTHHDGIIINDAYAPLLLKNKLRDFDTLMHVQNGTIIKQSMNERSTVKLSLKDNGGKMGVYLKRYQSPALKTWLASLFRFSMPRSAMDEWNNILAFHNLDIPTMLPLCAGLKKHIGFKKESFLLTREIEGVKRLDHTLAHHFSSHTNDHRFKEKKTLIKTLALLVRRMHGSGLNHRDLYLCHILVKKDARNNWTIYFADLHRVDQRKKMPLRWKVKDLAALHYSADPDIVTRTDRLRFITHYQGNERLNVHTKQFIKKIIKKTERIRSHDQKQKNPDSIQPG